MISSEATPFSKTGGLADVATSLTKTLGRMGHDVTLVTPRYRGVGEGQPRGRVRAYVADNWFEGALVEVPLGPGAKALLVDCPPLYNRGGIYAERNIDYPDNPIRYAFLSIAALEWAAEEKTPPSVFHGHDWQAGLAPAYARRFVTTRTRVPFVHTIHNLAYQGIFDKYWVPRLGLSWDDFTPAGFEFYDRLCFLKAGINFTDWLTTVSPTYAVEIQRPDYGYGFDGVIRARRDRLSGILNGIDTDEWNPSKDPYLPAPYDAADLSGKRLAKRALLEAFGLPTGDEMLERPVIGMVSRLVQQKGLDLIEEIARELPQLGATYVVVGTGEPRYERMWRELSAAYPDRISAFIGFDERRAHLVEGGADGFLMPSRFEPCGLNQMYSMRYGTVPIVRAVGGLVDTVTPYDPGTGEGTGFLFSDDEPAEVLATLLDALRTYSQRPDVWARLQQNGMRQDFSWERSASEYVKVYKRVMGA